MKHLYLMAAVVTMLLLLSGCSWHRSTNHKDSSKSGNTQKTNQNHSNDSSAKTGSAKILINKIIDAAKNGKVPGVPFTAGKTEISAIHKAWGISKNVADTKEGLYADYKNHSTTFGYYRHSPIFDVRSSSEKWHTITLKDVKQVMGSPDNVSSFDSKTIHQQILIYSISNQNQLKWILPKPDKQHPNPSVDHISVYNQQIGQNSISAKINSMSLDKKIGQMLMVGVDGLKPGSDAKAMIRNYHAGGIILYGKNIQSPSQTVQFTNQLKKLNSDSNNPLPLFISVDEEGGIVDRMPSPIIKMPSNKAIGTLNNKSFSYQVGQMLGKELQSLGFNMDYAPVLDVNAHPGLSVIGSRSYSSNSQVVSQLGVATMKGIQSKNVVSVIKHFPGYGSVKTDAHKDLPSLSYGLDQLEQTDWVPYKNAIAQGADTVIVTHVLVPKLKTSYPGSMSPIIINDMLRGKLNFHGVVMTDDMTMGAIENHYKIETAAVKSVQAGADIVMVAFHQKQQEAAFLALKHAVEQGSISKTRIDDSVYRIMQLKQKYKLSDQTRSQPDIHSLNKSIHSLTDRLGS